MHENTITVKMLGDYYTAERLLMTDFRCLHKENFMILSLIFFEREEEVAEVVIGS